MFKGKSFLTIGTVLVLFFAIVVYSSQMAIKLDPIKSKDVELVKRLGGAPNSSWKVLFATKDNSTINKIVTLVNSAN